MPLMLKAVFIIGNRPAECGHGGGQDFQLLKFATDRFERAMHFVPQMFCGH